MKLDGKVVLIVGGEGPLGREVTKIFLEEGAQIIIGWYSLSEWEEAKNLIPPKYKENFIGINVDATKEDQVINLFEKGKEIFGSIDILLHMVGIFHAGEMIWETETSWFDRLIEINLKSAFLCAKYAVKEMLKKGTGRILFFPGKLPIEPKPGFGVNAISKAGMYTLVLALREELKETQITVNAVMPSIIDTWRTRKIHPELEGKMVNPTDIAKLLSVVCSDGCNLLNGSIIKVLGKL